MPRQNRATRPEWPPEHLLGGVLAGAEAPRPLPRNATSWTPGSGRNLPESPLVVLAGAIISCKSPLYLGAPGCPEMTFKASGGVPYDSGRGNKFPSLSQPTAPCMLGSPVPGTSSLLQGPGGISTAWAFARKAEPQAPPQTYSVWIYLFTRSPGDL